MLHTAMAASGCSSAGYANEDVKDRKIQELDENPGKIGTPTCLYPTV